ncbi:MAG TPA: helix-turn-helix domain-containing protein [Spirochaetota bacterium]|nr:helix-turn-helix domain-containing protein [Spirochaetota bacterium]
MNAASFPVLLMATVCFYVGLYYLVVFVRLKDQKENLFFSLTCLSIGLYDVFCAGLYGARSVEDGMTWQRLQFASLCLFSVSIAWFIFYFTRYHSRRPFIVSTAWFFLLSIAGMAIRGPLTLSPEGPSIKHVSFADIARVSYFEASPGPLYSVQYASMIALSVFLMVILVRHFAGTGSRHLRPILLSFLIFFCAALNDALVGAAVYPGVYVLEYAYMLIILSMSYGLLNTFVDLHNEVAELNATLEKKVDEKTIEVFFREVGMNLCAQTLSDLSPSGATGRGAGVMERLAGGGIRGIAAMSRDIAVLSNPDELLRRIVEKAAETSGSVAGRFYIIGDRGVPAIISEFRLPGESLRVSERMVREAAKNEMIEAKKVEMISATHGNELYLPVRGRGVCIGVIYLRRDRDGGGFVDDDVSLLRAFLEATSNAIENALLYKRVRETIRPVRKTTITPVTEEKIKRSLVYIGENFTSDISREGLAASLSMHPDSLGRFFRMYTGKKISEYINELRIGKVVYDLKNTDSSIVQIAFSAGFESIATFNRAFLKVMKLTPKEYRDRHST